jgi:hypothetical protein
MDNGKSIGKTTELKMADGKSLYTATPKEASENALVSKTTYPLEAGTHEIIIKVADSVNEHGTSAVRIVPTQKIQTLWEKKDNEKEEQDE